MRKISPEVKAKLLEEPQVCARLGDGECKGRITWEHAIIYAGRQLDEVWAIIKLCEYHHAVNTYQDMGALNKTKNIWIALNRATDEELKAISKAVDWVRQREYLNTIYGIYTKGKPLHNQ